MPLQSFLLKFGSELDINSALFGCRVLCHWKSRQLSSCFVMSIYLMVRITIVQNLQVTAALSLAAACSSAGIIVLYAKDLHFCKDPRLHLDCGRFQISVVFAFITWAFVAVSYHVMFWILLSSVQMTQGLRLSSGTDNTSTIQVFFFFFYSLLNANASPPCLVFWAIFRIHPLQLHRVFVIHIFIPVLDSMPA